MRKETIDALIRAISAPPEERTPVIVRGVDQFGNEFAEELMVPSGGSVVTTKNVFYGPPEKAPNTRISRPCKV